MNSAQHLICEHLMSNLQNGCGDWTKKQTVVQNSNSRLRHHNFLRGLIRKSANNYLFLGLKVEKSLKLVINNQNSCSFSLNHQHPLIKYIYMNMISGCN